jgi:hypothetical protein
MIAPIMSMTQQAAVTATMTGAMSTTAGRIRRSQNLQHTEGLDEADANISRPPPAGGLRQLLLGHERLADAADQGDHGQQSGGNPQCEVHEVLLRSRGSTSGHHAVDRRDGG